MLHALVGQCARICMWGQLNVRTDAVPPTGLVSITAWNHLALTCDDGSCLLLVCLGLLMQSD